MGRGTRKSYDKEFKQHIVELYEAGQTQAELARIYDLHSTTIKSWVTYYKNSGSFKAKDNITEEEKQIKKLEQELRNQQMEIDILKKAMVIMLKH